MANVWWFRVAALVLIALGVARAFLPVQGCGHPTRTGVYAIEMFPWNRPNCLGESTWPTDEFAAAAAVAVRMRRDGKRPSDMTPQEQAMLGRLAEHLQSRGYPAYSVYLDVNVVPVVSFTVLQTFIMVGLGVGLLAWKSRPVPGP
jgi:hypothetical protein